ncbi:MAG: oxygen-insensitive NAD(P)H nitroreductase [Moraxella sp.]|nr:oxygen-insensitive NAD(P)H nitroreductase [Moraxella sp.]
MTDLLTLAQSRYTTKAYDDSYVIDDKTFDEILQILRLTPSSINSQPWHFFVAKTPAAKAKVAQSMSVDTFSYNAPKVLNASHVIVLTTMTDMTDAHLDKITDADIAAGRYTDRAVGHAPRLQYVQLYRQMGVLKPWLENQTHIALGQLLLAAADKGLDATPIGGFDPVVLDEVLGLADKGLTSSVVVAIGKRSTNDNNAALPKSRLALADMVSYIE